MPQHFRSDEIVEHSTDILTNNSEITTFYGRIAVSKFVLATATKCCSATKTIKQITKTVLAIIFGLAVFAKLSGKTKDIFEKAGYGLPILYATAFAEVLFVIGFFTQYDLWAAIG